MKELSIIGPKYLEKVRSSDYKNSIYAIAEIVDNSLDADAQNVEIITITKNGSVTDIYFVDDGVGMDESTLQKCVIFSETNNPPGSKKTGYFGFGLPNASLSQCTHFSAITEINNVWMQNSVDLEKMKAQASLNVSEIFTADKSLILKIKKWSEISKPKTIIHWTNLDLIDTTRAKTLLNRSERLLGRIHRYKIREGITLRFLNYSDDNPTPDINHKFLENDPLFITEGESWIANTINELANDISNPEDKLSKHYYFKKFIVSGNKNKVKPLFYLPDDAQEEIRINWKGKEYKIDLKLAVAYKEVQKPGMRQGGNTSFGKQCGIKVRGSGSYPSGNISWIRNGREITTGNYSLFNVTQENQRFWSIELNYNTEDNRDNVLDKLLGLSNSKQSLKFTPDREFPEDCSETASFNDKKQELIASLTNALNGAIDKAMKRLNSQARDWQQWYNTYTGKGNGGGVPGPDPRVYSVLLEALGKGAELSEEEQKKLVTRLKKYLPIIPKNDIAEAVQRYSDIGLKNIIIYCEIDDRDLIQTDRYAGKNITLVNVKHNFYIQVIQPLKERNEDDIVASLELLLSSISRTGQNSFFNNQKEIIKEFYELLSKDLKIMLSTQSNVDARES